MFIIALETFLFIFSFASVADAVERLNGNWTITNFNSITSAVLLARNWDKKISKLKLSIDAVVVYAFHDFWRWCQRRVDSKMLNHLISHTDSAIKFFASSDEDEEDKYQNSKMNEEIHQLGLVVYEMSLRQLMIHSSSRKKSSIKSPLFWVSLFDFLINILIVKSMV